MDLDGELKAKRRRLVGVDGRATVVPVGWRTGDPGRCGEVGVTSLWRIELKIEFACSLRASDSVGIIRFLDGVVGDASSMRWKVVRMSPASREGTNLSP